MTKVNNSWRPWNHSSSSVHKKVATVSSQISRLISRWNNKDILQLWLSVYDNYSTFSVCLICRLKAPLKQNFCLCPPPPFPPVFLALQLSMSEIAPGGQMSLPSDYVMTEQEPDSVI